jgi:hypothetical protein
MLTCTLDRRRQHGKEDVLCKHLEKRPHLLEERRLEEPALHLALVVEEDSSNERQDGDAYELDASNLVEGDEELVEVLGHLDLVGLRRPAPLFSLTY